MQIESGRDSIGTLFGRPIGQSWDDLAVWERVLDSFPEKFFDWIIELGTFQGGMSFYLYAQAWARQMKFYTVDIKEPDKFVPCFTQRDIKTGLPSHWTFHLQHPGILFCDNGNKPSEVYHFHRLLHRSSLVAIHDWGTEFLERDIPDTHRVYYAGESTVFIARHDFLNELEVRGNENF